MLLSEVEEVRINHLLTKRSKRSTSRNKTLSTLSLITGLGMVVNLNYQHRTDIIELQAKQIINYSNPLKYKERTRGDLKMNTHKNNDELGIIMGNLSSNPFYKKPNMDLLKEVNIKGHLSSKTPYIPVERLKLNDVHMLKGNDKA